MKRFVMAIVVMVAAALMASVAHAQSAAKEKGRQLSLENKPRTGDFDAMVERRLIRVLVPYSRTLYFVDKGRQRGVTADLFVDFEQYLNRKHAKRLGKRPLTVVLIPATRDKLLTGLAGGQGDISAGNLTVTEERSKIADFIAPADRKPARELLVTGPSAPSVANLDDLSGKTLHVRKGTSYLDSVKALNERFRKERKKPVTIVELPVALEDEDAMEMLNAGLLELIVVDDWKALMWAQILPKIKVREDIVLRESGHIGWAIRKNSPALAGEVNAFYRDVVKRQGGIERRLAQYHKRIKQISNNTSGPEWKRFEATVKLFEKYGAKYGFDPLMLAAQGYQESRLQQEARSPVGAIGVMQIMPATGGDLRVGDIHQLEPNIHAGAKYMDQLMTIFFKDAQFDEYNRPLFAFASYNAGPGNISKMRKMAEKQGLNPNEWFNNVELVVERRIGIETTTYVRNIYKYYVAYKLVADAHAAAQKARQQAAPGK